ncbi:hypothetical protein FHS77_003139 [Paenochrobactrum gallinarii]|uniref:Uncharacterized protein n=1 Tax=Paenochrobactrum gallinarii TaxID=643673 RepID=A0A841M8K1_9HYPH|nr:hypothetical protein [Paenochrobactrum gallinarii]MBB6262561.1 hypothetical protein [Paenochrobactrum gallinarii]
MRRITQQCLKELIRLEKQRVCQKQARKRSKAERKPDRNDSARVALYYLCKHFYEQNELLDLNGFIADAVNQLESQGFNKVISASVFDDLIDKYTKSNWQFRRKPHLNEQ